MNQTILERLVLNSIPYDFILLCIALVRIRIRQKYYNNTVCKKNTLYVFWYEYLGNCIFIVNDCKSNVLLINLKTMGTNHERDIYFVQMFKN